MLWGVVLFTPLDTYTHIWPGPLQSKPKLALASEPTVFVPVCNLFIHYLFVSVTKVFVQSGFFAYLWLDWIWGHWTAQLVILTPGMLGEKAQRLLHRYFPVLAWWYPTLVLASLTRKLGLLLLIYYNVWFPPPLPKKKKQKNKKKTKNNGLDMLQYHTQKELCLFFFCPPWFHHQALYLSTDETTLHWLEL